LTSISERGIMEPLQGVPDAQGHFLLLDGFKRYRCARQLQIEAVPCIELAEDVTSGILKLIRTSNDFSLHIIEQAKLVTELRDKYKMNSLQIATSLERSPAWVSVRLGLLREMTPTMKTEVFSGRFPARSFMYTVRQFTRVNKVPAADADEFVKAVSGKNLSGRAVDQLAKAYFQGGANFREQIQKGNFSWTLDRMGKMEQARAADSSVMGTAELGLLRDLEIAQKYEGRLIRSSLETVKASNAFYAEAELLTGGIIRQADAYREAVGRLYARCRDAKRDLDTLQARQKEGGNSAVVRSGQKNGLQDHQAGGPSADSRPQGQNQTGSRADQTCLQGL